MPAKKLKLPRGKVLNLGRANPGRIQGIVAVIPCATVRQARQAVKANAMTEGEKRFAIAKEIARMEMGLPSLSPAGFRGMRPLRIIDCCKKADIFLKIIGATP